VARRADQWSAAEQALRQAAADVLADQEMALVAAEGEAAFNGPKLDLQLRDGRGQEETIATVELDFNQPERFDLTYDGPDGRRHRVVMIHRGAVGSMERVVAALLERYHGRLPLWLAPVQVAVLPVGGDQDRSVRDLSDRLRAHGIRVDITVEGSLGARIRRCRHRRDAVIAVIGAAEATTATVQVTDVAAGFTGQRSIADFVPGVVHARDALNRPGFAGGWLFRRPPGWRSSSGWSS
jgi:threonyl-tRNA synthetase